MTVPIGTVSALPTRLARLVACLLACAIALGAASLPARAQTAGDPLGGGMGGGIGTLPILPQAGELALSAYFAETGAPIEEGLIWRVFELRDEAINLVARHEEARPRISLPPANYMVHVSWGFASAALPVTMHWGNVAERLLISAGGVQVRGVVGDAPIPPTELAFSVFVPVGEDSEARLVVAEARATDLIRLPEGDYHVVTRYGDANASARTDLSVAAGEIVVATLNHRAAKLTLKLVAEEGGEAFAGTAFSVLTPGGDVVREAIGAFPQVVLAEGEYVVIARHEGRVFTREFRVESGLDRDIEVIAGS